MSSIEELRKEVEGLREIVMGYKSLIQDILEVVYKNKDQLVDVDEKVEQ